MTEEEIPPHPVERTLSQKILRAVVVLVAVSAAVAVPLAIKEYLAAQERRLVDLAHLASARGEHQAAMLLARQAYQKKPGNATLALLADTLERANSAEEIEVRKALVQAQPGDLTQRLNLVRAAMRNEEIFTAREALENVPELSRKAPAYLLTAAKVAVSTGDLSSARELTQRCLEADPSNSEARQSLAVLELRAGNPEKAAEARRTLLANLADPALRRDSLVALYAEAAARDDRKQALHFAEQLAEQDDAPLEYKLLAVRELWWQDRFTANQRLSSILRKAAGDAVLANGCILWLNSSGMLERSEGYEKELSLAVKNAPLGRFARAQTALLRKDYPSFEQIVGTGDWGTLQYLQSALLARLHAETDPDGGAVARDRFVGQAVAAASSNRRALIALGNLFEGWNWPNECEAVWSALAEKPYAQLYGLKRLYRLHIGRKATLKAYECASRIAALQPNDPLATNNKVQLGLLLGIQDAELHRLAAENARKLPGDPAIVSTHAFSLLVEGNAAEAVRVLESFPPAVLQDSRVAGYFGLALAMDGRAHEAEPALKRALSDRALLPEERRWFEKAGVAAGGQL